MLTVNGQKMSKSLGNSFLPDQLFSGNHTLLDKGYSPMTVRFFMLQAHYRSTLDFRNDALQAAEKGLARLLSGVKIIEQLKTDISSSFSVSEIKANVYNALNEDFNTPIALAHLFDAVRLINSVNDGKEQLSAADKEELSGFMQEITFNVLGLKHENDSGTEKVDGLMKMIIDMRADAKSKKDFATSDFIRYQLKEIGIEIKDGKEGASYRVM
jgi:cysteinyl-tRNA synthetase